MPKARTITKVCANCGGRIRINSAKYCGQECYRIAYHRQRSSVYEKWELGDVSGVVRSNGELTSPAGRYLKDKAGNQCSKCGWGESHPVDGTVPLEIDHIDGNPYNQNIENLAVLCPNCHSLTPTYGARNRGNGRRGRHKGL